MKYVKRVHARYTRMLPVRVTFRRCCWADLFTAYMTNVFSILRIWHFTCGCCWSTTNYDGLTKSPVFFFTRLVFCSHWSEENIFFSILPWAKQYIYISNNNDNRRFWQRAPQKWTKDILLISFLRLNMFGRLVLVYSRTRARVCELIWRLYVCVVVILVGDDSHLVCVWLQIINVNT